MKELIEEMEDRAKQFAEYANEERNDELYWAGREDEAKAVIKMLKAILNPCKQLPYDKQGDDGDLLPV